MEDRRKGQAPDRDDATTADATAARTRPIDAPSQTPVDATSARAAARDAEKKEDAMRDRGFGGHKGTEAE